LAEFDYTINYKRGKENLNSDGLSRMYTMTTEDTGAELTFGIGEEKEKGRSETLSAENEDGGTEGKSKETKVRNAMLTDKEKLEILRELHETPVGGHIGMN
jgi:hypothetical protein